MSYVKLIISSVTGSRGSHVTAQQHPLKLKWTVLSEDSNYSILRTIYLTLVFVDIANKPPAKVGGPLGDLLYARVPS